MKRIHIAAEEVPPATRQRWQVDYAALSGEAKEADQVWARKVLLALSKHGLIQQP